MCNFEPKGNYVDQLSFLQFLYIKVRRESEIGIEFRKFNLLLAFVISFATFFNQVAPKLFLRGLVDTNPEGFHSENVQRYTNQGSLV